MRWDRGHQSGHVIDRRGQPGFSPGRMGMLLPLAGRFGWKGILILLVVMFLLGRGFLSGTSGPSDTETRGGADDLASFVGFVLDDAQAFWERRFLAEGGDYRPADLVLFTNSTATSCGYGTAAVGPFYCPNDRKVYIDLDFYRQLRERFGAPGDMAQAYVIAHEIGHHVQAQRGLLPEGRRSSIAIELQADCLAGAWARSTKDRDLLEEGDIDEALGAAAAVGDDTLQRKTEGRVQPETWRHGSAAQRTASFRRGFESGDPARCDTATAE